MDIRSLSASVALLVGLASAFHAQGKVIVQFVEPQNYTDAGDYGNRSTRNLATLERYMQAAGARCLKDDERLELQVLDVDLAGRQEWWHGPSYDTRIMRDITWPRLEIAYLWQDAVGQTIGHGRERVSDMAYLWRSGYVRNSTNELPYEKAMLQDWFERNFCGKKR